MCCGREWVVGYTCVYRCGWLTARKLFFPWRAWHFHTGWTSYQLYSSSNVARRSLTVSIWAPDPSDSYNNINLWEFRHEATNKLLPSHDDATALSSAAGVQYSPPTRVALVLRRVLTCVWSNTICLSRLHMQVASHNSRGHCLLLVDPLQEREHLLLRITAGLF